MEIRENNDTYIIVPLSPVLDAYEASRIFSDLVENESRRVAVDLSCVVDCTIDFIENLKNFSLKKEIGFFNIPSDIFVLFNMMSVDKLSKLFVSESDFMADARRLLNRKFKVLY
jgi:anti-anti-sigma regulatory factor